MEIHNKTILVTGSEGFIGSHLVEKLLAKGANVKAFYLYNSSAQIGWLDTEVLPHHKTANIETVSGDLRDYQTVYNAMRGCDAVLHLGALVAIPYSYYAAQSYIDTNVTGTLNVLTAARELSLKKVIHTSTSEVYGTAQTVPISETHPLSAQSPYAASKVAADQLALAFHCSHDLPVAVIRPFNTFGPRQSARAIIPTIISQIAAGHQQIKLGALTPTRDFNFVDDITEGFYAALTSDSCIGTTTNLGTGFEISIGDTANLIAELMQQDIDVVIDEQRIRPEKSEVNRLVADNSLAQQRLNWQPQYSGLDNFSKAMAITIDWFKNPANLAKYKANVYNI